MKRKCSRYVLPVLLGCMALGLWLTGETWAWPTVLMKENYRVQVGTVDCQVWLRTKDADYVPGDRLPPDTYAVEIFPTGDVSGWFLLTFTSGDTAVIRRTPLLEPGKSMHFALELEKAAEVTVDCRWDRLDWSVPILNEGDTFSWDGNPEETEPETDPTEPSESEPETDPTEPSESEPETDPTEPSESEPETDPTEPSESEPTEP